MADLKSNLEALAKSRAAAKARTNKMATDLASFVDMKVNMPTTPVGAPTPAAGAVARRVAGVSGTPVGDVSPGHGGLNSDFQTRLNKLIAATGGKVHINSGYRSPERQAQLFAAAVKKYGSEAAARKWVAPPGHSEHNKGLAVDLGFADAATKAKVHQIAKQYGLYFPMSWEDWHIQPLGT